MANLMKNLKVPPNSTSREEARKRTFDFFRLACRSIPNIMEIYNLDDVVTPSQLRSTVASEIRKNAHVTNPKVFFFSFLFFFKGKFWFLIEFDMNQRFRVKIRFSLQFYYICWEEADVIIFNWKWIFLSFLILEYGNFSFA